MVWGILIAGFCMALFVFLIKGWYKDAAFSPVSYIVGVLLFLLLSFQCVLIVGSLSIINMTDEYEERISTIVDSVCSPADEVSSSQASEIIETIIKEYPILQYYISGGEFAGYTAKELPHVMALEIRSYMRWYIFRRVLWCLGFVLVGAFCVIKTMSRNYARQKLQRVQHDRKRVSRRPRR